MVLFHSFSWLILDLCMCVCTSAHVHVCTHVCRVFINQSLAGHLGCFHCLSYFKLCCYEYWDACILLNQCFHFFQIYTQKWNCWILYTVVLFLAFWGTSILFLVLTIPTYIPSNVQGFPFLHTLTFVFCRLFDYNHIDWYDVIPNCGFYLHFTNNRWCWASFHVPFSHLYIFFWKVSI